MADGPIAARADFSHVRYAQCWEDADVLAEALAVRPGSRVLSICSAGDNALALLIDDPAEVVAVDLSAAQLACLALRVAAFRTLEHAEVLELVGSRPSERRLDLYRRCRPALDAEARRFWDARPHEVEGGIGSAGRFERFFRLFRHLVLPLAHPRWRVEALLEGGGTADERRAWYRKHWETRRWRALFAVVASRAALGRARDPRFFDHVEGAVADRIRRRVREAVTETDPARNPYLWWILTGAHGPALPRYLRPEHFDAVRQRLDRITPVQASLEDVLEDAGPFSQFNLSDVFEYVDPAHAGRLFAAAADAGRPGARLAYWNLLADRRPPPALSDRLRPLPALAERLHRADKAPFYAAFRVDEVVART
jgi:S-adenosylmethionine-diacylglycerol 3-amino-3-carboxypropyl transferase